MSKETVVSKLFGLAVVFAVLGNLFTSVGVQPAFALGTPQITVIEPSSPQPVGMCIKVRARVDWDSDFRSMRMRFGSEGWQESAEIEFERTFCTNGYGPGWYTIRVEVARQGDNDWASPTSAEASYQLTEVYVPPAPTSAPTPSCSIDSFDVWPSPAVRGQDVRITGEGSCNTGVRAIRVKIDGGTLYEIGAPSLDTTWHTSDASKGWHDVTIEVVGLGDNNWNYAAVRSKSVQLTSPEQPTQVPSSGQFNTGDVIQIGYDIFVIVSGERRLVPNPETLDALGIPRSWVNNRGLSDSELKDIHRGSDIPDVLRDPSGFQAFKNWIFPNTSPIVPSTATPKPASGNQPTGGLTLSVSPTSVAPGGTVAVRWSGYSPDGNDWVSLHPAGGPDSSYLDWQRVSGSSGSVTFTAPQEHGWYEFQLYRNGPKVATSNRFQVVGSVPAQQQSPEVQAGSGSQSRSPDCEEAYGRQGLVHDTEAARPPGSLDIHQCTGYAASVRTDAYDWLPTSGADAKYWPGWARAAHLWVHSGSEAAPRPDELVVWQPGCGPAPKWIEVNGQRVSGPGHVAVVTGVNGNEITVSEANVPWGSPTTTNHRYQILGSSCMSFIAKPGASVSVPEPSKALTLWSKFVLWVKNQFGW